MTTLARTRGVPSVTQRRLGRVAVVGGGLGGLAAAGHLARAGHAVTLFEQAGELGGKAARLVEGGVTLDWGPTLLTSPDVLRGTFEALGAAELLPPVLPLQHHCRYEGADGARLDVYQDLQATLASAEAIAPGASRGLENFYARAERLWRVAGGPYLETPFRGTVDYLWRVFRAHPLEAWELARLGTLAELAHGCFELELLLGFAGRFATYAGASPLEASAIFAMIAHLERSGGVHHVAGGLGTLGPALGRAIERLGVEVRLGRRVEVCRQPRGLVVDDALFDAVVLNRDPLAEADPPPSALALSGYVLLLEVDRRLAWPHHSIFFARDYRAELTALCAGELPVDATVAVCHPVATDASMAPEGKSGLHVMVNAPPLGRIADAAFWEAERPKLRARLLERLRARVPGLAGASVRVLGERTPVDLAALGAPRGSIYGFLPRGRWGPFRRPPQRSDEAGVFYAGGGTFPGGGVPLVLRSGAWAAQLADTWVQGGGR